MVVVLELTLCAVVEPMLWISLSFAHFAVMFVIITWIVSVCTSKEIVKFIFVTRLSTIGELERMSVVSVPSGFR